MIPRRRAMRKEDFPGQEEWIEPLLRMIGDFNSQTVSALTDGLTFGVNMKPCCPLNSHIIGERPESRWIGPRRVSCVILVSSTMTRRFPKTADPIHRSALSMKLSSSVIAAAPII